MKDDFQYRIYNYEVTPPATSWEKITDALDENEQLNSFSSKLYNLESAPPGVAWENIKASLDDVSATKTTGKKISLHFFRYAAAIIILGLMIWGSVRFLNNGKNKTDIAKENNASSNANTASSTNNNTKDSLTSGEKRNEVATLDLSDEKKSSNLRSIVAKRKMTNDSETNNESIATTEDANNTASRYIALMTPDGNMIRMSKKWADMVCCVSGSDDDPDCKDQLQKWREQIACSPLAPSSGNFMDILSLISSLQNN